VAWRARNRLKACKIAGVKPRFERLNGGDLVAYILSSNDCRDLTQDQRAMIAAELQFSKLENYGEAAIVARGR
jgi:hypothetical protein